MAGTYGNYAWSKLTGGTPSYPAYNAPIDPQHQDPSQDPNLVPGQTPNYVNSAPAPLYPDVAADFAPVHAPGGPVAQEPEDHGYGVGAGPGLTQDQAAEIRGFYNNQDFGTPAAQNYVAASDRFDGDGPHVAEIPDVNYAGDSPQTVAHQRTGIGVDPLARTAKRQKRWWNRTIDNHWFLPSMRPLTPRNAYSAPAQPAVASGGPTVSPFPSVVTYQPGSDDRFVPPQDRRVPEPWDTNMTADYVGDPSPLGAQPWGSM